MAKIKIHPYNDCKIKDCPECNKKIGNKKVNVVIKPKDKATYDVDKYFGKQYVSLWYPLAQKSSKFYNVLLRGPVSSLPFPCSLDLLDCRAFVQEHR